MKYLTTLENAEEKKESEETQEVVELAEVDVDEEASRESSRQVLASCFSALLLSASSWPSSTGSCLSQPLTLQLNIRPKVPTLQLRPDVELRKIVTASDPVCLADMLYNSTGVLMAAVATPVRLKPWSNCNATIVNVSLELNINSLASKLRTNCDLRWKC